MDKVVREALIEKRERIMDYTRFLRNEFSDVVKFNQRKAEYDQRLAEASTSVDEIDRLLAADAEQTKQRMQLNGQKIGDMCNRINSAMEGK